MSGQNWEVVGGGDKGGILIREGEGLASAQTKDRLSTGAIVQELELKGERLYYLLLQGTGPVIGWASIKLKDKDLLVKTDKAPKDVWGLSDEELMAKFGDETAAESGPVRPLPPFKKVELPAIEYGQMKEVSAQNAPGDYYGIPFPHTKDQILQWGSKWLTKAFVRCGVMAPDNEVTELSMVDVTASTSGGAGLKYLLKVKYKHDKPYLQTDLFVKLPHEPKGSDRYYVSVMWGHDRPETIFNIWQSPYVPFKVPKLYFCDICAKTTNYILITEQVKFAEKGTTEYKPGDIEASYHKMADWEMCDGGPMYYLALCRNLGKMAAYHKTGKLHPDTADMFPMPDVYAEVPKGMPGQEKDAKRMELGKFDAFILFLTKTAVAAFPKEITDQKFLEGFKDQSAVAMDYMAEIHCFCSGAGTSCPHDYVGLTHNNLQVDNAIFYRTDANEVDAGMLDWGVLACGPLISAVQGGCISGAQVHIFIEYRDKFIQAFIDSYAEHGGPKLDLDRMRLMSTLLIVQSAIGCPRNTMAINKDIGPKGWANITSLRDERVRSKWNAWAHCWGANNNLLLYQHLDAYSVFQQWLKDQGLPSKKD